MRQSSYPTRSRLDSQVRARYRFILSGHRENYFISGRRRPSTWSSSSTAPSSTCGRTPPAGVLRVHAEIAVAAVDFGLVAVRQSNYAPEVFYGYASKIGDVVPAPARSPGSSTTCAPGSSTSPTGETGRHPEDGTGERQHARGRPPEIDVYFSVTPRARLPPFGAGATPTSPTTSGTDRWARIRLRSRLKHWWGGFATSAGRVLTPTGLAAPSRCRRNGALATRADCPVVKFTPYFYVQYYEATARRCCSPERLRDPLRLRSRLVNWITLPNREPIHPALADSRKRGPPWRASLTVRSQPMRLPFAGRLTVCARSSVKPGAPVGGRRRAGDRRRAGPGHRQRRGMGGRRRRRGP
jgi:hypothetical protein